MKTTIEWLQTLPQEIRDDAIANMRDFAPNAENKPVETLSSALFNSLSWVDPKWPAFYTSTLKAENESEVVQAKPPEHPKNIDDDWQLRADWLRRNGFGVGPG